MKTYELSKKQIEMIVEVLNSSIDAMEHVRKVCEGMSNITGVEITTKKIGELTTLKNYLEQY